MLDPRPWPRGCGQIEVVGVLGEFEVMEEVEALSPNVAKTPTSTLLSGSAFWRFDSLFGLITFKFYSEDDGLNSSMAKWEEAGRLVFVVQCRTGTSRVLVCVSRAFRVFFPGSFSL